MLHFSPEFGMEQRAHQFWAGGGGGALSAIGQIGGSLITAGATRDAAKKQAQALMEINKWGYGYPDWLTEALKQSVTGAQGMPQGWEAYLSQLQNLGPLGMAQFQNITGLGEQLAGRQDLTDMYRQLAKAGWGQGARSLEELGLTGGALQRARTQLGSQLGQALTQAGISGEQAQREMIQQQAQLAQAATGMLPTVQQLFAAPIEAQYGQQGALQRALATATGIPGYQYTPPQIPTTGQFLGPAIASATNQLGSALAYNQGLQAPGGYSNPYLAYQQQYYDQTYGNYAQRNNPYNPSSSWGYFD